MVRVRSAPALLVMARSADDGFRRKDPAVSTGYSASTPSSSDESAGDRPALAEADDMGRCNGAPQRRFQGLAASCAAANNRERRLVRSVDLMATGRACLRVRPDASFDCRACGAQPIGLTLDDVMDDVLTEPYPSAIKELLSAQQRPNVLCALVQALRIPNVSRYLNATVRYSSCRDRIRAEFRRGFCQYRPSPADFRCSRS